MDSRHYSEFEQSDDFNFSSSTGKRMLQLLSALVRFVDFFLRLALIPLTAIVLPILTAVGALALGVVLLPGLWLLSPSSVLDFIVRLISLPIVVVLVLMAFAVTMVAAPFGILLMLEEAFLLAMSGGNDRVRDLQAWLDELHSSGDASLLTIAQALIIAVIVVPIRLALTIGIVLPFSIALSASLIVLAVPSSFVNAAIEAFRNTTTHPLSMISIFPRFVGNFLQLILWSVPTAFLLGLMNGAMIYQGKEEQLSRPGLSVLSFGSLYSFPESHSIYDMLRRESRLMRLVRSVQYLVDVVPDEGFAERNPPSMTTSSISAAMTPQSPTSAQIARPQPVTVPRGSPGIRLHGSGYGPDQSSPLAYQNQLPSYEQAVTM
ncbi:MAG TPA: hypothetical protein VNC84_07115 [Gammaproteobacteria bacterium]|jgi:hypothetical protein|nr:hypothetical protein [Gammaproteobacteria bacterium]